MEYFYKFTHPIWQKWPLPANLTYPRGDNNNFINYSVTLLNQDLRTEMERIGLTPDSVNVFYTAPNKSVPIHVDGFSDAEGSDRRRNICAINWTFTENNHQDWKMIWYHEPTDPRAVFEHISEYQEAPDAKKLNKNPYTYTRYKNEYMIPCQEIAWEINPVLIRTNIPHNVVMLKPDKTRWCASIRFATDDFDYIKKQLILHY